MSKYKKKLNKICIRHQGSLKQMCVLIKCSKGYQKKKKNMHFLKLPSHGYNYVHLLMSLIINKTSIHFTTKGKSQLIITITSYNQFLFLSKMKCCCTTSTSKMTVLSENISFIGYWKNYNNTGPIIINVVFKIGTRYRITLNIGKGTVCSGGSLFLNYLNNNF